MSTALNSAVLPGNLSTSGWYSGPSLRFDDVSERDGSSRGVTMNSFALPDMGGGLVGNCSTNTDPNHSTPGIALGSNPLGSDPLGYCDAKPKDYLQTGPVFAQGELNTWHINYEGWPLGRYYNGRGTPPTGWVSDPGPNPMPADWVQDTNEAYPFNPHNPDNGPRDLQAGDYIIMRGTLWQEHAHDIDTPSLWRYNPALLGHVGLVEMHPIDWIQRLQPPAVAKTAYMVACAFASPTNQPTVGRICDVTLLPFLKQAPLPSAVFNCTELIDGRYSDMSTVVEHAVTQGNNQVAVHVRLSSTQNRLESFKAVYLMWWQPPLAVNMTPTQATVGTRVTLQVHAQDGATGQTVAGRVKFAGQDVGSTDSAISYVFERVDITGAVSAPGYNDVPLQFSLAPGTLKIGVNGVKHGPSPVTVQATNLAGEAVNNGTVSIAGQVVGKTNVPFSYTFQPHYVGKKPDGYWVYPTGTVTGLSPHYQDVTINFTDYAPDGGP